MGKSFLFLIIILFQVHSWGKLLILEVETLNDNLEHAQDVSHIACRDIKPDECVLLKGEKFLFEEYQIFQDFLPQAKVANMSLGFQLPVASAGHHEYESDAPSYSEQLEEYHERTEVFAEMIDSYPQTLFVAAAGNGYNLGIFWSLGMPLSEQYPIYPAYYKQDNLITVTSLVSKQVTTSDVEKHIIADYANFSLLHVELAAPVEDNLNGEEIRGTSFSAPYVSRLAYRLMKRNPNLSPLEIKEILMKSAFIVEIDRALEVTLDWIEKGPESMIGRLELASNLKERNSILQEIGPIMMVKSGGPLVEEVAELCEAVYRKNRESITDSCLIAQQKIFGFNASRLNKTQQLWQMRQF